MYTDVQEDFWAYEDIRFLSAKKAASGYSDGEFKPNNNITRAEIIKMIAVCFGLNAENNNEALTDGHAFNDVPADAWFAPYVNAAYGNGIIYGGDDNNFFPGRNVTRQELACMIHRLGKLKGFNFRLSDVSEFKDEDAIGIWALESVKCLQMNGIVNGDENGRFMPESFATRAEAAKVLRKIYYLGKEMRE